jgi:hypothetical protein
MLFFLCFCLNVAKKTTENSSMLISESAPLVTFNADLLNSIYFQSLDHSSLKDDLIICHDENQNDQNSINSSSCRFSLNKIIDLDALYSESNFNQSTFDCVANFDQIFSNQINPRLKWRTFYIAILFLNSFNKNKKTVSFDSPSIKFIDDETVDEQSSIPSKFNRGGGGESGIFSRGETPSFMCNDSLERKRNKYTMLRTESLKNKAGNGDLTPLKVNATLSSSYRRSASFKLKFSPSDENFQSKNDSLAVAKIELIESNQKNSDHNGSIFAYNKFILSPHEQNHIRTPRLKLFTVNLNTDQSGISISSPNPTTVSGFNDEDYENENEASSNGLDSNYKKCNYYYVKKSEIRSFEIQNEIYTPYLISNLNKQQLNMKRVYYEEHGIMCSKKIINDSTNNLFLDNSATTASSTLPASPMFVENCSFNTIPCLDSDEYRMIVLDGCGIKKTTSKITNNSNNVYKLYDFNELKIEADGATNFELPPQTCISNLLKIIKSLANKVCIIISYPVVAKTNIEKKTI